MGNNNSNTANNTQPTMNNENINLENYNDSPVDSPVDTLGWNDIESYTEQNNDIIDVSYDSINNIMNDNMNDEMNVYTDQYDNKEIIDIGEILNIEDTLDNYDITNDSVNNIMRGGAMDFDDMSDDTTDIDDMDIDDMDTPMTDEMFRSKGRHSVDDSMTPSSTSHDSEKTSNYVPTTSKYGYSRTSSEESKDNLKEYDYGFSEETSDVDVANNEYGYSESSSRGFEKSSAYDNRISTSSVNTEDLDFIFERGTRR
jgi:hypothetical protein